MTTGPAYQKPVVVRLPRPNPGRWIALLLPFLGGALLGCGEPEGTAVANTSQRTLGSIVEVAQVAGQFSALIEAAQVAGLAETLHTGGPFTVFAPTDGAFSGLPEGTMDALKADPDALGQILLYHVVPGRLKVSDLRELTELETVQGSLLQIRQTDQGITINGTYLLTADVPAENGVIHVITAVLVPG